VSLAASSMPPRTTPFNPGLKTTWVGTSPLPVLPFSASSFDSLLVVSMFAGTEALLITLLALDISFVATSVESDEH
jgi:hypothetical protein